MRERGRAWAGCILLACAAAAALPAAAEGPPAIRFEGAVEAGVYRATEDSYDFGAYTGLKDDLWYPFGNVELEGRAPWDSGDTWYLSVRGANLGLEAPWARIEGGLQGLFGLWVEWDDIPRFEDDTGKLAFSGRGTDLLRLPAGWIAAPVTGGFGALRASLEDLDVYRERRALRAGAGLVLPAGWEWLGAWEWEQREGRRIVGAAVGNTGGNPRTSLIPQPTEYETHEVDTALRFANETFQLEIGYEFSTFDNDHDSLTWQNPFAAIGGWDPSAGFPTGFGRKALEPDNTFHQIRASGGYNLPGRTRIAAFGSVAWFDQDEAFLPYTVNPALAGTVAIPLPRNEANAEILATTAGVRLTSRPIDRLRISAGYRLDDRDNDTERDVFVYIPGDSAAQDTIDSSRARRNLPNSYRLHEGRIDLAFELFERTELSAGYEHQREIRSWTETDELDDDIFRLGFRTRPIRQVDFRVDGEYWVRDAGDYFYQAPVVWGFSPEHVATIPPGERWENLPPLRKFNYTDFERGRVDARLHVMPVDAVTLGLAVGWSQTSYDGSELGLRERDRLHWTVDLSWSPTESLTAWAWYTKEDYRSKIRGRQFSNLATAFDSANDWVNRDVEEIDTVGAGADWVGFGERLRLRGDYAFSWARERNVTRTNPGLAPAQSFPDDRTFLHSVSFRADYRVREGLTARFGYLFEWLDDDDWSYDDVGPATVGEVLALGQSPPDYTQHLFAFSVVYEFGF